jgi:tetratricopeptide (TPR) repeat protein
MRLIVAGLLIATGFHTAGYASDTVIIAPPPPWVKAAAIAKGHKPDDGAPVRILLLDQQVHFQRGRQSVFSESAIKIQTPQGLAAGNISLPWRPETDTLAVHKLLIRRGEEVIDVLASGQTFTILRRETNLERAMLDGVLTANIQPEGLQVGDVVEFSASITSCDPTLQGHVEQIMAAWNDAPIERAHLRVDWPDNIPVRIRQLGDLPPLKPVKKGDRNVIEFSLSDTQRVVHPQGAPLRFGFGRLVELSDFSNWSDLSALMAPLYRKAAIIAEQSPLQAEIARIKSLSTDPVKRAEVALALVQDRVRYVALAMGHGGLVPADATQTWARRYGDCKGKTALLLGLLAALDIEAEAVLVNTQLGDGLDSRLPMVGLFDHVLVRATIGGKSYWLDGTRTGDASLERIAVPTLGWGLPLRSADASLVRIMPEPLTVPTSDTRIHLDARSGLDAQAAAKVETVLTGDAALAANLTLSALAGDDRDRALKEYWKSQYDFIDVKNASASFDPATGSYHLVMDGDARMDWSDGGYTMDGAHVGYKADFSREPGPQRDAPFAVAYPYYTRISETILLPPGFEAIKIGADADVDRTVAGIEYRRRVTVAPNSVTMEKTERSIAPEFPFEEAAAAQAILRDLTETSVFIPRPKRYVLTEKDVEAKLASAPTTVEDLIDRGNMLMDRGRLDEAIADFTNAVSLDSKDVWALANRGIAYVWKGDVEGAKRDLDAAEALDADNPVSLRARGLLAEREGDLQAALDAYEKSLKVDPRNGFALGQRARLRQAKGQFELALEDASAALDLNPAWPDMYLVRANAYRGLGKEAEALAEAQAVMKANPESNFAHVVAANIYDAFNRTQEALAAYDRALAIKPEALVYLNRGVRRPRSDVKGRREDIDQALKLNPALPEAVSAKAALLTEEGDVEGAIAAYSTALATMQGHPQLLLGRGIAYALQKQLAKADKDLAAARTKAISAEAFNEMCWGQATAGVLLESALADCEIALEKAPGNPAYLDSKGLVLLRLGRIDEAIATYDAVLAKTPTAPSSLYGRAVAWARKGDPAKSDADAAAALKFDPDQESTFKAYGITR